MQRFGARSWRTIGFVSVLSAMLSSGAAAQSSTTTWGGPVNTDYNIPSNWTRGVPTTDTTAVFGTEPARTTITDIGRGPANIVATWQILAGSPAYTFTMAPLGNYTFNYAGIVNESSVAPTFNVTSSTVTLAGQSSLANANVNLVRGNMLFTSTATAGTATIAMSDGSEVAFAEQATGGQARFILGSTSAIVVQGAATGTLTIGSLEGGGTSGINYRNRTLVLGGNNLSTVYAGEILGTGALIKTGTGTIVLSSNNLFPGSTVVNSGGLVVNGTLSSPVTVNGGALSGGGTISGGLVINGGTLAPGNSIGTMTLNGNLVHNSSGTYQVEVNAAGQGDRINATGTATLNGGTVQVLAQQGSYAPRTTYTVVNATGGLTGAFSSVTSSYAFLSPALSYDANNAYLTLSVAFANGGQTPNQQAAGVALDQALAGASGDTVTVIGALSIVPATLGPSVLDAISPQPYAGLGTTNVAGGMLFMNALGQQMAMARRGSGNGTRQALAKACDVAACEDASPWSVWASGLGGLGSVQGNGNASTLTYNLGGAAAGFDYRIDPRFLVGVGAGYAHGTQWVNSFYGQGWSDFAERRGLRLVHAGGLLPRCPGRIRLFRQPGAAPDPDPGPAGPHRQRQHRRQRLSGSGRGRLQDRHLGTGAGHYHAVRPPAGGERDAKRLQRMGRQCAQPRRRSADDQLAALDPGRRPRREHSPRRRPLRRSRPSPWLAARIRQHGPADHRGLRRRAVGRLHDLWRHAAARFGGHRLFGRDGHRGQRAALSAVRWRGRWRHRQPRPQSRRKAQLVAASALMRSSSWRSSAAVGWRQSIGTCGGSGLTRTIGGVLARARRASAWSVRPAAMSASAWSVHRPSQRSGSRRESSMERTKRSARSIRVRRLAGMSGHTLLLLPRVLAAGRCGSR